MNLKSFEFNTKQPHYRLAVRKLCLENHVGDLPAGKLCLELD